MPATSCLCSDMTPPTDVSSVAPIRRQDVTGALRARRYQKLNSNDFKASVTVEPVFDAATARGVTAVSTVQMCALAARISDGRASREDWRLAERLIMALVDRLPPDSSIQLADDEPA